MNGASADPDADAVHGRSWPGLAGGEDEPWRAGPPDCREPADGAGGGGWGPVVTTSLLGGKMLPKKVIGTVNASEFFINLASATTLLFLVKITDWEALAGLIIGGFLIAPYAAKATSKMSIKMILTVVGCLIIIISLRKIIPLFI